VNMSINITHIILLKKVPKLIIVVDLYVFGELYGFAHAHPPVETRLDGITWH
tara:strand:+ start:257 stop:412 length:156 start_codon:yes stop_codon:yes gene_type:complete